MRCYGSVVLLLLKQIICFPPTQANLYPPKIVSNILFLYTFFNLPSPARPQALTCKHLKEKQRVGAFYLF